VQYFYFVTFPEAFLPVDRLLRILEYMGHLDSFGCVHAGLRPSDADPNHLFLVSQIDASALSDDVREAAWIFQVIVVSRAPGASRSFRYSSIARMISFLIFSIVRSSRRRIPTSSLTFLGCFGWPAMSKPSPLVTATFPPRGTIE
jgi:hypothetical protein